MKCPHCGVYYMDDERECPVCGKRPGIAAKKKKYTPPISYDKPISKPKKKAEPAAVKASGVSADDAKPKNKKPHGCLTVFVLFVVISVIANLIGGLFSSCSVSDIAVPEPEPLSSEEPVICLTIAPGTWHIENETTDLTAVVDVDNTISWTVGTETAADLQPYFTAVENPEEEIGSETVRDYPSDTYDCYNLYFYDSETDSDGYDFYMFLPIGTSPYELEDFDCYNSLDETWYMWIYEGETFELP